MPTNAAVLTRMLIEQRGDLLRFLHRQLDRASAEDVAQSLYFKLLRVADEPPIENKRAFLFRMAANLATDHARVQTRLERLRGEVAAWLDEPSAVPDAQEVAARRQELQRIARAVAGLPAQTRRIFALNRFDGLTQRQIAERLQVSDTTVEKHIRRALAAFGRARDGE
ncbi:MAG: sigma-70 family RNA polymerase sigma factor [Pseudoxanthomonas sp.]